jgi:broad specificity polyphosphatase/5'/3'-nucleotidase SurE
MLSAGQPKGIRVVPQSTSGLHEHYVAQKNGAGEDIFQLAGGAYRDDEAPTDTTSLSEGFITVTALAPDMTDHKKTQDLRSLFAGAKPA